MSSCCSSSGRVRASFFDAPVDVIFSDTSVAQPDLLVVKAARRNIISERGIEGARLVPATARGLEHRVDGK